MEKSFTLIELLVVISIIGLLATIVFIMTPTIMPKARDARITQDFHKLLNLAEKVNLDEGSYDSLCEGSLPCDEDVQKIYEDINKRKGTLVIQKPASPAQSYCAFSPLNSLTEENQTQYYCIDGAGGKIKTTVNPGLEYCTQDSFNCPTQLVLEGEFIVPPLTASVQVFRVSTKEYPYFREVTIDPLDVRVGDLQIMLVEIEDPDEISWIRTDIEHDNGYDTVMLTLTDGDSTRGIWGGQWKVHDTHYETYHTTFTAQNRKGKQSSITLAWTDPCSPPVSGNWSLSEGGGSCAMNIDEVHGLENGDFTVDSGTITISEGATWAFNPGQSIKLTGGSIAINKTGVGGQIKKTYLWMVDSDNDHYASSTASLQHYGAEAPTVGGVTTVRRNTITDYASLDYDDRNASIYPGTTCNGACTINQSDGSCAATAPGSDPGGSALSCSVTSGSCANTTVLKISGTSNAHAEQPSQANYTYYVCCSGESLGTSCSGNYDTCLKLSTSTATAVETLGPNAAGDFCEIPGETGAACPNHWQNVDDPVDSPDDGTTKVNQGNTAYKTDTYNLEASSISSDSIINSVTVYFRFRSTTVSNIQIKPILRLSGNQTDGTEVNEGGTNWRTYNEQLSRPGGGDWAVSDLDDLQVGISMKPGASGWVAECTQVYVKINYTPPTNTHVEKKTQENYSNSSCLSTTYSPSTITCDYNTDCANLGSLYECVASISGDTNAHIGDCNAYSTKVCCANVCP